MSSIRAVYHNGTLRLSEPLDLSDGQEVEIVVVQHHPSDEAVRAALGDFVRWTDPSNDLHAEVEAEAEAIALAVSGGTPLSEMILDERGER